MRRALAVVTAVALSAVLAACSGDADAGDPTTFAAPSYSAATVQPQPLRAPSLRYQVFQSDSTATLLEYLQRHSYLIYDAIGDAGQPNGRIGLALDRRGVGARGFPLVGIPAEAGLRLLVLVACDTAVSRPRTLTVTLGIDGQRGASHAVTCGSGVGTTVFYLGPDQRPTSLRIAGPADVGFAVTGISVVV